MPNKHNIPTNKTLWRQAKQVADKTYDKPSAYKSGFIVKYYIDHGGKFKGNKTKNGLTRWFKEKWTNQHGKTGYQHKNDIYRPSVKVSPKSPKTWAEIPKRRVRSASREKYSKGRVSKF